MIAVLMAVSLNLAVTNCDTIGGGSGHLHVAAPDSSAADSLCDAQVETVFVAAAPETIFVVMEPDTILVIDQATMDCVRACAGPPYGNPMWTCLMACLPAQ